MQTSGLALLRHNRPFSFLWCSRSISFVGDSLGLIALLLYVATSTGRPFDVALLMLVGDFAPTLLSPLTGALGSRCNARTLMVLCEVGQGVLTATIGLGLPSLPALLALVALRTTLGQLVEPAARGVVPILVADDEIETANAALGVGTHGMDAFAPLVAAALLPLVQIRGLLLIDALTYLISALLLSQLPSLPRMVTETGDERSLLRETREGLRYIWSHPAVRIVVFGFFAIVACNAMDDVALVFLARGPLHAGNSVTSLLYAGVGSGLLLGFAALSRYARALSMPLLLVVGFGLHSAGNLLTGLSWTIIVAFGMQGIRGVGISMMDVAGNSLLQRLVPPALRGRVFANFGGAIGGAAGLSYVVGGLMLGHLSPRLVFILAGSGGLLAALIVALLLPRALTTTHVKMAHDKRP